VNSRVRIVKRERSDALKDPQGNQRAKPGRQMVREIESTIKSWVADLQQRKRAGGECSALTK
jgi:hypothetical protein